MKFRAVDVSKLSALHDEEVRSFVVFVKALSIHIWSRPVSLQTV